MEAGIGGNEVGIAKELEVRREVRVVADLESEAVRGLRAWKGRKGEWVGVTVKLIKGM